MTDEIIKKSIEHITGFNPLPPGALCSTALGTDEA